MCDSIGLLQVEAEADTQGPEGTQQKWKDVSHD